MANRPNKKKDEDSSGGGWFGLLAGAVAVGAAAYGAKKLYDVCTQPEKEETKSCSDSWSEAWSGKCVDYEDDDDDDVWPKSAAPRNAMVAETATVSPGGNLHQQLNRYYERFVDISSYEMSAAQQVVDDVVDLVQEHLENTWPEWNIGALKQVGSTVEGLKVIQPDEFDFMIPIGLSGANWKLVDASSTTYAAPGFWLLEKTEPGSSTPFERYLDEEYLSPAKIRSAFQGAMQKMINKTSGAYTITPSTHGPSVTLTVKYGLGETKSLCIDFVPTVSLCEYSGWVPEEIEVVGKPHPFTLRAQDPREEYKMLWRRSFSTKESQQIEKFSTHTACHATCLKILKAVLKNHPQVGMLNSYVLKTVLLHEMDKTDESDWPYQELSERFVDLVRALLGHVEQRHLPHYFTPDVNLFTQYNDSSLFNLETYLQRLVRKNDFSKLLEYTDYFKACGLL